MFCVLCAALAAGLTMGFMSQDAIEIEIKSQCGTEAEKAQAKKVLNLLSDHHLLLVTLLLFNSAANEALPLCVDHLVPSYVAILLSVTLVLIFGEIVPSAIFTGPRKLQLSAAMTGFVRLLVILFFPISRPIASLLDRILGHQALRAYTRQEIATFVSMQRSLSHNDLAEKPLGEDEVMILNGVLKMSSKTVFEVMTPLAKVYMLNSEQVLDEETLNGMLRCGYSRIPIYQGEDSGNIRGYLIVKKLIVLNPNDLRKVSSFQLKHPLVVHPKMSLLKILHLFKKGIHMAVVSDNPSETRARFLSGEPLNARSRVIGILTLEDVMEQMLQGDIDDEKDRKKSRLEKHYLAALRDRVQGKRSSQTESVEEYGDDDSETGLRSSLLNNSIQYSEEKTYV